MRGGIQLDTIYTMKNDEYSNHRIAVLLRETRLKSKFSLRQTAKMAGTSHATILAYESGKKVPSVVVFLRILEAYGYSVDFILNPRIRYRDGIERGEELADVLRLAEQFPANVEQEMSYTKFGHA